MTPVTDLGTLAIITIISCILVFLPYVQRVSSWFITIIHEAGHGVLSLVTGGGIHSIVLRADGSGEAQTLSSASLFSWFRRVIVLFAGYSSPIILGIGLLLAVKTNNAQIGLYVLTGVGVLTLLFIRNFFGVLILAMFFSALWGTVATKDGYVLGWVVTLFACVYIVGGVRDLVRAGVMVFLGLPAETDFHFLQQSTYMFIPAQVWYVMYIILFIPVAFICSMFVISA